MVSQKGVVKGIKKRTVTITVYLGNKKYDCKLTVSDTVINENKLDMEIADTAYLSIKGSNGPV